MTAIDNLGDLIADAVTLFPDRVALIQTDLVLTYRELDDRCNRVAAALLGLGVRPGDRVALCWPNDVRYIECLLGAIRAGAVAVPLNVQLSRTALEFVVRDSDAIGILVSPALADMADALGAAVPTIRFVRGPDALLQSGPEVERPPYSPGDVCFQPYTSGSTGRPKGVLLTHHGQIWCADAVSRALLFDETERSLVAVPVYHKNAGVTIKTTLIRGGSVVVLPRFDSAAVIAAIEQYRCTYLAGVPAMFRRLVDDTDALARHDVSSLRFSTVGSAEVPADLLDAFEAAFGSPVGESYGLTEGGPDVFESPRWGVRKRGSTGLAVPGCEVRLIDPGDPSADVAVGEVGELLVRNPGVMLGYHKLPEETAARLKEGWLSTGDLMRQDEDGYFFVAGRRDEMMNVGGENVYPKEVEDLLLRHPAVADAAVVAVPHREKGVVPVAFVVLHEGWGADEEELKRFSIDQGPLYAHPRRVLIRGKLPLGGTGKVDRTTLKELAVAEIGAL